jgi:hypothetical protein
MLNSAPATTVGATSAGNSANNSTAPETLGGVIEIDAIAPAPGQADSISQNRFESLSFGKRRYCSAVFEFGKNPQGSYFVDAWTNADCIDTNLLFRGNGAVIKAQQVAPPGRAVAYATIPVTHGPLAHRNRILRALDGIPGEQGLQRALFIERAFANQRLLDLRSLVTPPTPGSTEPDIALDLCIAVPAAEIAKYQAAPADTRGSDPRTLPFHLPAECQLLVNGGWYRFDVPQDWAKQNQGTLDRLVSATTAINTAQSPDPTAAQFSSGPLARLKTLNLETRAAEEKFKRTQLVMAALRAAGGGCASPDAAVTEQNKILAGPHRDFFITLAMNLVPTEQHELINSLRTHNCTVDDEFRRFVAIFNTDLEQFRTKIKELATAYHGVQSLMKAHPQLVGIATNHITTNADSQVSVAVAFGDLPLFPRQGSIAAALKGHAFSFANPWLSARFDTKLAHPQFNNLRHEYTDGYAITFAGKPVGAMRAEIDESGGVAVLPLPVQSSADIDAAPSGQPPAAQSGDNPAQDPQNGELNPTTTIDNGQESCSL